jgi:hypothetical protein
MRRIVCVLAVVFFFAPIALWVGGVRAHPFENRRLAGPPKPSQRWDAFDQTTRFFVDRMPLREQAVRANTWTSVHVFDTSPDYARNAAGGNAARDALPFGEPAEPAKPAGVARTRSDEGRAVEVQPGVTVVQGKDDWLFLDGEFVRACSPFIAWKTAIARIERLTAIIRASGRRVVFAIPPDKSTIYPEYLPSSFKEKDCLGPGRAEAWRAIEGASDPGVLGLRQAMLAAKASPPEATYYPADTHWDTKGAVLGLRAVLERLGGRAQVADGDIVRGRGEHTGDLSNLRGDPQTDEAPEWRVQRPVAPAAVAKERLLGKGAELTVSTRRAGGAPLLAGRTLFVYDSFGVGMLDALGAYTRDLATVLWYDTPNRDLIEAIARSRTVILEKVERDINFYASDQGVITPAFLRTLAARLDHRPVPGS